MFKKIEVLSNKNHQDLRFTPVNSFNFAATVLNAPLGASEFHLASRHYPIIFPSKSTTPLALFALNQKTNSYVRKDDTWSVPYIPAHIRRYPFVIANTADKDSKENFVVCIDTEAPHFADGQGNPMFTADGEPADITKSAISFLEKFHYELTATQKLCQELDDQDVLVEKRIVLEKNGKKESIAGFRCVDMKKVIALEDAVLAKWVRNGLIGLINAHLQSMANIKG